MKTAVTLLFLVFANCGHSQNLTGSSHMGNSSTDVVALPIIPQEVPPPAHVPEPKPHPAENATAPHGNNASAPSPPTTTTPKSVAEPTLHVNTTKAPSNGSSTAHAGHSNTTKPPNSAARYEHPLYLMAFLATAYLVVL